MIEKGKEHWTIIERFCVIFNSYPTKTKKNQEKWKVAECIFVVVSVDKYLQQSMKVEKLQ